MSLVAYAGPETGQRDRSSYVLQQGKVRFVLTTPLRGGNTIAEHIGRHGDGVKVIALWVDDARRAWTETTSRGAVSVAQPYVLADERGQVVLSSIRTYGDTIHTFVERGNYSGAFLPGYRAVHSDPIARPTGLIHIDHSDFASRTPLATASDAVVISEGAGNISGDPRFVDAAHGDYHLLAGSPAIDAGIAADQGLPTDLDGSPRLAVGMPDGVGRRLRERELQIGDELVRERTQARQTGQRKPAQRDVLGARRDCEANDTTLRRVRVRQGPGRISGDRHQVSSYLARKFKRLNLHLSCRTDTRSLDTRSAVPGLFP